jgi:hypothetical protein
VINTELGSVPLRVGLRNDPQLYTTELDSSWVYLREDIEGNNIFLQSRRGVEVGDWVNGTVFSMGIGMAWSQIEFDLTYEYATYDDVDRQVITALIPYDPGARTSLEPWTTRDFSQTQTGNKYSRIMISFTGHF